VLESPWVVSLWSLGTSEETIQTPHMQAETGQQLATFRHNWSVLPSPCNRFLQADFCEKNWFLTWAHQFTESRRKTGQPSLHFTSVSFALSHSLLQLLGIQEGLDWWMTSVQQEMKETSPQKRNNRTSASQTTCQAAMTLIVTRSHLANPQATNCQTTCATPESWNTAVTGTF
jgi:hypothetical protein